jgi:hypothetical protein
MISSISSTRWGPLLSSFASLKTMIIGGLLEDIEDRSLIETQLLSSGFILSTLLLYRIYSLLYLAKCRRISSWMDVCDLSNLLTCLVILTHVPVQRRALVRLNSKGSSRL